MMSTSMTPFTSPSGLFHGLRREMDTAMRRFFDLDATNGGTEDAGFIPSLDLSEDDKQFEVTVDLPGVPPEDVKVEFRDGNLWISGEYKSEKEETDKTWHRIERSSGQFRRVVTLGQNVDPEKIDAEYRDGVLRVSVAKRQGATNKRVEIRR
jgi:HSP20 family protein